MVDIGQTIKKKLDMRGGINSHYKQAKLKKPRESISMSVPYETLDPINLL